jgi:hypothetical protein
VLVAGGLIWNGDYATNTAELYNAATGTWTLTGSLNNAREGHTATLLPDGQVLVAGGYGSGGPLTNAEVYNPASGTWTVTGSLHSAREFQTATLLPNGQVLVAGGDGSYLGLTNAELYNVGLGFDAAWQPQISSVASALVSNGCLTLSGSLFRGIAEGSGGNSSQDSPADYPVVQLLRLDNEQTLFLLTTDWSTNSLTTVPVTNFPSGYALATVFVNGIPSAGRVLYVGPLVLGNPTVVAGGALQFFFGNTPGVSFRALGTTDLTLPLSSWTGLGSVTEVSAGQFEFADGQAMDYGQRFYCVCSP